MTPRKGDNYGSLKRSNSRGGTLKKYKFVSSDHLDEESFSKWYTSKMMSILGSYELILPSFFAQDVLFI